MRTALLANNRLGVEVGRYLAERGELVGLLVHPLARRRCHREFADLAVPTWEWPEGFDGVRELEADCLLSVLFGYRVPASWLELPRWSAVNLHPGFLPWNAGCYPNVWPLVDGSPAGTTLHVMEEPFDTGAVLAQERVPTYLDDTAKSLYERLEAASLLLVHRVWPGIEEIEPVPQRGQGSYHGIAELSSLTLASDEFGVIDKLRARTFPPHGLEFERGGKHYRARVEIEQID